MTRLEFLALCNEKTINYFIALENEAVRQALQSRNDEEVNQVLDEEF